MYEDKYCRVKSSKKVYRYQSLYFIFRGFQKNKKKNFYHFGLDVCV